MQVCYGVIADNETLMNVIQNYRVMYDKSCKEYKDIRKKKNAWEKVAEELEMGVSEVQRRYNSIRTKISPSA